MVESNDGGQRTSDRLTVRDLTNAAVVIGVAPFKKAAGDPPEVEDAKSFARWLGASNGGNVPQRNLRVITSRVGQDDSVIGPTFTEVESAFGELYQQPARSPRGEGLITNRLTIVVIGPGFGERDGRVSLQLPNDPDSRGQAIELTAIADQFRDSGAFDEVVLIVDVPRFVGHQGTSSAIRFPRREGPPPVRSSASFYVFSNRYGSRKAPSSGRQFIPVVQAGLEGAAREEGVVSSASLAKFLTQQFEDIARVDAAFAPEFISLGGTIIFSRDRVGSGDRRPLATEGGKVLETEGERTLAPDESGRETSTRTDSRIQPSTGGLGFESEPPTSRTADAIEAAQRILGGGLRFVREAPEEELCLNIGDYANAVAQLYASAGEGEFCLAVFGAWGRGKTSLMRKVEQVLSALGRGYRTIQFSAWKYPSAPEVWVHLYEEFAKAAFDGPWYRAMPNVVRAGVIKHGARPLLWAYATFAFGLIPLGTFFKAAQSVVVSLYPWVGVIGFILLLTIFIGVRRTKARLTHEYLTASRHTEKLGLQATIGSDLRALLMSWIPDQPLGRAFTAWYAAITAVLIAAVLLRLSQGAEIEYLAKTYLGWTVIGAALIGVALIFVIGIVAFFAWLLHWLRTGGDSPRRILLVVDDLDRCKPEHLLSVMESIKLLIEDPEIYRRVQVAMLLEEDIFKHAIFEKYGHLTDGNRARLLHTHYDADQLIWENGEKLFMAHLRLPVLSRSELKEVIERVSGRRRDEAVEERSKQESHEKYLEEQLARERSYQPLGTSEFAGGNSASLRLGETEQISVTVPPDDIAEDREQHEERLRRIQKELEQVRARGQQPPPVSTVSPAVSPKVLEEAEIDAILAALDTETKARRSLGPRAIRAFVFRYQLARLLLYTLKIEWEPQSLAKLLAQRSFGGPSAAPGPISADLTDEQKVQRVVDQVC